MPGANGQKTCQVKPTPTPTASPTPTATPTPTPSPTPTPIPFNPQWCKCDNITYSPNDLATGQATTITSFAKVLSTDKRRAQVVNQTFRLFEGAENSNLINIIMQSNPIPSTISLDNAEKTQYKSVWNFTMPTLKNGMTYRIQSVINCQPKPDNPLNQANSGPTVSDSSIFAKISAFFARLMGIKENVNVNTASKNSNSNIAQAPMSTPTPAVLGDQINIGTFLPISVYQTSCEWIKFKVGF